MPTNFFVLIRVFHFASCLLILGVWAFDRFVAASILRSTGNGPSAHWKRIVRRLTWTMLPIALLSGALWLVFVAANMSGLPFDQAIMPQTLSVVWNQTTFGATWKWRLVLWIVTAFLSLLATTRQWSPFLQSTLAWCVLLASGALAAGLAWAGHGLAGSPWHRAADLSHLLAAGCWPAGLLPFFWLFKTAEQMPPLERRQFRGALTRRFSMMSLWAVGLLCITGLVNSWVLVASLSALSSSAYGQLLLAKILLFMVMANLGALNLIRWKPQLFESTAQPEHRVDSAGGRIRANVAFELILAVVVVIIVAVLGTWPPPAN